MPSDSNGSSWVLPAILLGVLIIVLVWCSCGSRPSSHAVRLQKRTTVPPQGSQTTTRPRRSPLRRKKRPTAPEPAVISATRSWTRTCTTTRAVLPASERGARQNDQKEYYPQIHHYFRSNENSYESTVQKRQKKKGGRHGRPSPSRARVRRTVDALENCTSFFVAGLPNVLERPWHRAPTGAIYVRPSARRIHSTTSAERGREED